MIKGFLSSDMATYLTRLAMSAALIFHIDCSPVNLSVICTTILAGIAEGKGCLQ
jgi:hypothetical protein